MTKVKKAKKVPSKKVEKIVRPVPQPVNPDLLLVPCVFVPKEDITAYELAVLLHFLINEDLTFGAWKMLEQKFGGITRHLQPMQNVPKPEEKETGE